MVVDVVEVVVVLDGAGNVAMRSPDVIDISVNDPVAAPGVVLFAPERLATQRLSPETANADSRLK